MNIPVPEDSWYLSVASTGLLFMALNITIAVKLYKNLLDIFLMVQVPSILVLTNNLLLKGTTIIHVCAIDVF